MKKLDPEYTFEVDSIDKKTWNDLLIKFDDSSFYQTWSYGAIQWGERNLSHLILKKSGIIVSVAQLRILKLPLLSVGIAYISWGPIWKLKGEQRNISHLRNMIRALHSEYVENRGLFLRIIPKEIEGVVNSRKTFEDEGFRWNTDPDSTVIVDLMPSLDEIRKNLRRGWRRSLDAAEKEQFEYVEGSDDQLFEIGIGIVREMKRRKKFVEFKDWENILFVHKDLPETLKLRIVLCKYKDEPIAVLGWFPIGEMGRPLLGATSDTALPLKASFPLWWKMIEYYKNNNFIGCDLAGVNKERNPGGYTFKTGLAGKKSNELNYIGKFDACESMLSSFLFNFGNYSRNFYRDSMIKLNKLKRKEEIQNSDDK